MIMENDGMILKIVPWQHFGKSTDEVSVTLVDNEYGESMQVLFTKPDIDQIVDALYEGVGHEVIPLRDEILAFLKWHDPYFNNSSNPHDYTVDSYLEFLERSEETNERN